MGTSPSPTHSGATHSGATHSGASLAIFTICSNNYIGMARVLLKSAGAFHPEASLYLCLVDTKIEAPDFYPPGCVVVPIGEIGLPDFDNFVFRYDIMELNTAVKPFMFQYLFRKQHDQVLYFDPDIEIFSRLEQILAPLAAGASLVLTPHLCAPVGPGVFPDEISIMQSGIFNLGFLAAGCGPETEAILTWWARLLTHYCINDQKNGVFVDQKFIDLVPGFANHLCILRDPTLNIAYWNLAQRALTLEETGGQGQADGQIWKVDGQPLGFYHFSGFDPDKPDILSKYTPTFRGEAIRPALRALLDRYGQKLRDHQHRAFPVPAYGFGYFASGTPIPALARRMFREAHADWAGNPFETYEAYMLAPAAGSIFVNNVMAYLQRGDTITAPRFEIGNARQAASYAAWFLCHGNRYLDDPRLLAPLAEKLGNRKPARQPPRKRRKTEPDIVVAGYLRAALGLGEAGRQNLRALTHAGWRANGLDTALNSSSTRNDRSCEALLIEDAPARFHLFNINADQLPANLAHFGSRLRPDAYRIMMPFWELAHFPTEWMAAFDAIDEVWAPTRFIQTMLAGRLDKPVMLMPLLLDFTPSLSRDRASFGLPEGDFLFFFAFDYFSFIDRKNPISVVAAYKQAFRRRQPQARIKLVLKSMNADIMPESSRALREMLLHDPDIVMIEQTLERADTLALIGACDAVISLHRSEGLGLLVAEAMVLGKPVIATDYSATTDLVSSRTGWPVAYQLIPVPEGAYPFHQDQRWADADISHAAWQMRQVVDNPTEAGQRAAAAQQFIRQEYGIEAVAARQTARLREIEQTYA